MKAMILAAGLGTRLRPITDTVPKALVQVKEKTMLERVIERLERVGVDSIVVNVHHFADHIQRFISAHHFKTPISIIQELAVLETAGGVANAFSLLEDDEPVLVHNVDVLSLIDIEDMIAQHVSIKPYASLAVRVPATSRPFLVNAEHRIVGYHNKIKNEEVVVHSGDKIDEVRFCGIHIVSQNALRMLHEQKQFWVGKSLTDFYLSIIANERVMAFDTTNAFWLDIGTPEKLKYANTLEQNIRLVP